MTAVLAYVDPTVLARSYLPDEPGHTGARRLVEGEHLLLTSTLALLEVAAELIRAGRAGRVRDVDTLLGKLYEEVSAAGPITLIRADQRGAEDTAHVLVRRFGIRAHDALHLAAADLAVRPLARPDEEVGFAAHDDAQRSAASDLGLVPIRTPADG